MRFLTGFIEKSYIGDGCSPFNGAYHTHTLVLLLRNYKNLLFIDLENNMYLYTIRFFSIPRFQVFIFIPFLMMLVTVVVVTLVFFLTSFGEGSLFTHFFLFIYSHLQLPLIFFFAKLTVIFMLLL